MIDDYDSGNNDNVENYVYYGVNDDDDHTNDDDVSIQPSPLSFFLSLLAFVFLSFLSLIFFFSVFVLVT